MKTQILAIIHHYIRKAKIEQYGISKAITRSKPTWPGGRIASNLSTPNIPRFDSVNVPVDRQNIHVSTMFMNIIRVAKAILHSIPELYSFGWSCFARAFLTKSFQFCESK